MKKFLATLFVVSIVIFPAAGQAQGIEAGQSMWSIYGGLGTALEKSDMEMEGKNLSWGNLGGEIGLSYLYFPSEYFGLGVDLRWAGFKGSDSSEPAFWSWYWDSYEEELEMHTLQLMASGRLNLNPGSQVRLYVPFGAGLVLSEGRMAYTLSRVYYSYYDHAYYEETVTDYDDAHDTSFGWYAGVGLEFAAGERAVWGLEARYNSFRYDYGRLADDVGGQVIGKDTKHSYISLVLKISFK